MEITKKNKLSAVHSYSFFMVLIIVQQHPNCLEGYSSLCLQNFTSGKLIFLMQPTTPKNLDTAIDNLLHPRIQNPFT